MVLIVVFFVMMPCDSVDLPMLASVRKCKKRCKKIDFLFLYPSLPPCCHCPLNCRLTLTAGWAPTMWVMTVL
jgi:hypothetical protein